MLCGIHTDLFSLEHAKKQLRILKEKSMNKNTVLSLAVFTALASPLAGYVFAQTTHSSVTLGDENGSLVYEVIIGKLAVMVDAGNGRILARKAAPRDRALFNT